MGHSLARQVARSEPGWVSNIKSKWGSSTFSWRRTTYFSGASIASRDQYGGRNIAAADFAAGIDAAFEVAGVGLVAEVPVAGVVVGEFLHLLHRQPRLVHRVAGFFY